MNLLLSVCLTLVLGRPVTLYGPCLVTNVIVWHAAPVLAPPAAPRAPREMGAAPHVARI